MNHTYFKIEFNNKKYNCREVFNPDTYTSSIVAPEQLNEAINKAIERQNNVQEAINLDEQICFYANEQEMKLTDKELLTLIYK